MTMVLSTARTVKEYLASLPDDRRAAIEKVADVVRTNLPADYEEGMLYGSIGWYVPLSRLPDTYNGKPLAIACLGNHKSYMALYLMSVYGNTELHRWFVDAFRKAGKKLDMGKSCVRFKTLDALPLDVIAAVMRKLTPERYIEIYRASRRKPARGRKR